jgi:glycosyltransferase involved in cell wall biosynthesis
MRILHVLPSVARAYGGPTQSLLGYLRASATTSLDCDVAAPTPPAADVDWWSEQLRGKQLNLFASSGRGALVTSPGLMRWVWENGARYDVIHVHALQNPVSSGVMRMARVRGRRFIVRTIGMLSEFTFTHRRRIAKRAWFALVDRPSLRGCSGLHFTTVGERDEALLRVARLGLPTFVVPPPFAGTLRRGPRSDAGLRLVFLGRIHPVKNLERLVGAWRRVTERLPEAELVVAGDGDPSYVAELKATVHRLGIARSVSFPGFLHGDAKARLLATATASALLSHHENFGVAALETMAVGIPSVLSPTVHLAPFALAEGIGIVVDPRDDQAVADAIVRCLTDSALQAQCRERGPTAVERTFSLRSVGTALAAMYGAICASPAPIPARVGAPSTWW